jgi:hypothetical protein
MAICVLKLLQQFEMIYLLGHSVILTTWSRGLGKLIVSQLVKKVPAFYGTQNFIAIFTGAPLDPILSQMNPFHILTLPPPPDMC